MSFLIFAGIVSLVAGIFFLFFPERLIKLNEKSTRSFSIEGWVFRSRVGIGIACVLVSIMCSFVVYYITHYYAIILIKHG